MRRAVVILALVAACHRPRGPLEVMVAPWFSPDETHPSVAQVFREFRDLYPDTRLRFGPGKADLLLQKLWVLARGRDLPDVVMCKTSWARELGARGILAPLPEEVASLVRAHSWPTLLQAVVEGGHVWAMPYDTDVRLIHYRRDLVASAGMAEPRPGWTLPEFLALARALTTDSDGDGLPEVWGCGVPAARSQSTVAMLLAWACRFGASPAHPALLQEPALAQAMGLYLALRDSLGVIPPDVATLEQADVFQGMASGRFAMTLGGSWEISMLRQVSPYGSIIAQAPLPDVGRGETASTSDGWAFGLTTRDPRRARVAADLLVRLFSQEHQRQKLVDHGWLPVRREGMPWVGEHLGPTVAWTLERAVQVPGGVGWTGLSEALLDALHQVLVAGRRPEEALQNAQRRLERVG